MTTRPTRTPVSAGNWKMNANAAEARALCDGLTGIEQIDGVDVVLGPGFLQLAIVADAFGATDVGVAGQNMHTQPSGAYTGEVSPAQLAELADWVILGHSERRQFFCEDDLALQAKLVAAAEHHLKPILCVGETEAERENNRTRTVLTRQLSIALGDNAAPPGLVVAYEPVWAIGAGQPATPEQAQEAAGHIRALLEQVLGDAIAAQTRVLYGGSVKPDNVADFVREDDVDGALVGGAALDPNAFLEISRRIAGA